MADIFGTPMPYVKVQFLDDNSEVAAAHKLFVYEAGTSTKATTWSDKALGSANANPIVLDSAGRASIFLNPTATGYKFVLAPPGDSDPPDSPIWSQDLVAGVGFSGIGSTIDTVGVAEAWDTVTDTSLNLIAPPHAVTLYSATWSQLTSTPSVTIPAGTLGALAPGNTGALIVAEWETGYSSATLNARLTGFGTALDAGTGAASTGTRARYVFSRVDNNNVQVSMGVLQNTGGGAVQVEMGQQTVAGLDLDATAYSIVVDGMASGTWTGYNFRVFYLKAYGDLLG